MAWSVPVCTTLACMASAAVSFVAYTQQVEFGRACISYQTHTDYLRGLKAQRRAALRDGRVDDAARLAGFLDAANKFGPRAP